MKKNLGEAPLYIGGWLLLIALRLILGIASYGNSLLSALNLQLNMAEQILRILSILFLIHQFVVLYLLLKRHKAFPPAYIILESLFIIINLYPLFQLSDFDIASVDIFEIIYTAIPVSFSTLWIVYILISKRVKMTFVFNWNETFDQRLIDKVNSNLPHDQPAD